jgi:hypothetical protein
MLNIQVEMAVLMFQDLLMYMAVAVVQLGQMVLEQVRELSLITVVAAQMVVALVLELLAVTVAEVLAAVHLVMVQMVVVVVELFFRPLPLALVAQI